MVCIKCLRSENLGLGVKIFRVDQIDILFSVASLVDPSFKKVTDGTEVLAN